MVIEINKDIDRYKESVVMGLTAKQLIYSVASVVAGGGIVLLLYPYIGLTPSVYVAVPVVAPIALGGFYSYNGRKNCISYFCILHYKWLEIYQGQKAIFYEAVYGCHYFADSILIGILSGKCFNYQ